MSLADDIKRAQASERRWLADAVAKWRLDDAARFVNGWLGAQVGRYGTNTRERRPAARGRTQTVEGDGDPHIEIAPPWRGEVR